MKDPVVDPTQSPAPAPAATVDTQAPAPAATVDTPVQTIEIDGRQIPLAEVGTYYQQKADERMNAELAAKKSAADRKFQQEHAEILRREQELDEHLNFLRAQRAAAEKDKPEALPPRLQALKDSGDEAAFNVAYTAYVAAKEEADARVAAIEAANQKAADEHAAEVARQGFIGKIAQTPELAGQDPHAVYQQLSEVYTPDGVLGLYAENVRLKAQVATLSARPPAPAAEPTATPGAPALVPGTGDGGMTQQKALEIWNGWSSPEAQTIKIKDPDYFARVRAAAFPVQA